MEEVWLLWWGDHMEVHWEWRGKVTQLSPCFQTFLPSHQAWVKLSWTLQTKLATSLVSLSDLNQHVSRRILQLSPTSIPDPQNHAERDTASHPPWCALVTEMEPLEEHEIICSKEKWENKENGELAFLNHLVNFFFLGTRRESEKLYWKNSTFLS